MKKLFVLMVAVAGSFSSCHEDHVVDFNVQLKQDIAAIDAYLATNSIDAIKDPSGVRYVVTSVGTGVKPALASRVSFTYVGRLLPSNQIFGQSSTGVTIQLNTLIQGWQIVVPMMNKGSKFTMYIPSGLGYGTAGASPDVPANANLIFEVELLDDDAQLVADVAAIDKFMADSLHIAADSIHKDPSGLRYVFTLKGTGPKPTLSGFASLTYRTKTIPDQTVLGEETTPSQVTISEAAPGLQTGLLLTPTGSQITYYVPSGLAFGPSGSQDGVVKPNTNLIYEVKLISAN